uniref:Sel1 domain protein repeat-containing protein n=1 Tax=uncultured Alphaproteobacteria bacterium TaxID=91750 RepID=A0A1B0Z270_9PROT|nr:Sel1 domain protein repeat-containing protein [uncultured Alphaproteobacteria bacterium]
MGRIAATLAVIALLFSVGSAWADDNSEANELFVGAVKLVKSADEIEDDPIEKAAVLEEALGKLNEIIDNYPSSDLAVKLISGQSVGNITFEGIRDAAIRVRRKADARPIFEMTLKLAEQGLAGAQFNVGEIYYKGYDVPRSYTEAVKWWRKAAEQGHAGGKTSLGLMYWKGLGVPQDIAETLKLYREAAEQGHAGAKTGLGEIYFFGFHGVPEDIAEGLKLWREAAEQGHVDAQLWLGTIYQVGTKVPKNKAEAIRWYRKAAEQGHYYAKERLKKLEAK